MAKWCSMTRILCTVALLWIQVPASFSQKVLSYPETIAKAAAIINAASKDGQSTTISDIQKAWPLLFSSTIFESEIVKAVDHLADAIRADLRTDLVANMSTSCVNDTDALLVALVEKKGWAWQMIDAMGKPPPDLKGLNFIWPGAYKECLNVRASQSSGGKGSLTDSSLLFVPSPSHSNPVFTGSHSASLLFTGQYCTADLPLLAPSPALQLPAELLAGVCVPNSCSDSDVATLIQLVLRELNITLPRPVSVTCQDPDKPLDNLAIAGIVVVAVIGFLMLVGTVMDVIYTQLCKWRRKKASSVSTNYGYPCLEDDVVLLGNLPSTNPQPGKLGKLVMAFSVYSNGAKLLSTEQTEDSLGCVHGIRFLSMTWVVLGHTFTLPVGAAGNAYDYVGEAIKHWTFQAIANATYSVDSFFVLSGLLVAYLSLKQMKRTAGKLNWVKFFVHRFWRLTPPYMLIILVYVSLSRYWGSGPQWLPVQEDRDNCRTTWWTNLLYINNFVHTDKMCFGHSWYLANDMQFYILSPLIFVPFYYSPLVGVVSGLVFLLATTVTPAALTMKDHFPPPFFVTCDAPYAGADEADFYIRPYNRMGPYIIGILTGYLLYHTNCRVRLHKGINLLGWGVASASALTVLYGLYHAAQGHPLPLPLCATYNAVSRTAWGLAVAWVIFACVTGNGGFVNTILSWKALIPLSRLTYCVYLLHIMVLGLYVYSRDTVFYYTNANVVVLFLAVLVVCYGLSAVVSLAFEAPMLAMEKLILSGFRRNQVSL